MKNTKDIDSRVLELFNKVRAKQKKISSCERVSWLTNCSFGYNPEIIADRVNLHVVNSLEKLVDIYAFLLAKEKDWEEACSSLGLTVKAKWLGFSIDDWKKDVKSRVEQLQVSNEKKELKVLEDRLNSLISLEQRRAMELEEIEREMKE